MTTLVLLVVAFLAFDAAYVRRARPGRADQTRRDVYLFFAGGILALVLAGATIPNTLYLGKVLGRLAMPAGLLWIALGLACAWRWHHRQLRALAATACFLVAYTAIGSPAVGGALLYSLEAEYRSVDPLAAGPFDAVFVMGGGTGVDPRGRPFLTSAGDRVLLGARLAHENRTPIVVTSGSTIEGIGKQRDIAEEAAQILEGIGVSSGAIRRLPQPRNSAEEIQAYRKLAESEDWSRVGLVTSAWHLRRSVALAEAIEFEVTPLPADFRGSLHWDGLLSVIPDGRGFRDVSQACWEYLGALVRR